MVLSVIVYGLWVSSVFTVVQQLISRLQPRHVSADGVLRVRSSSWSFSISLTRNSALLLPGSTRPILDERPEQWRIPRRSLRCTYQYGYYHRFQIWVVWFTHLDFTGNDAVVLLTASRVLSFWSKKLQLDWDLPFTQIQGVTVEDTGIRFAHKAGKENDKFAFIPDKGSQSWFFGQVALVVKSFNARKRMDG